MHSFPISRRLVVAVAAVAIAALAAGPAFAGKTVYTRGGDSFSPNEYLSSTLHFDAGTIFVRPGERVTWVDGDHSGDAHSITTVIEKNVPGTVSEIFSCPICELINQHLNDPNDPDSGIGTLHVNRGPVGMQSQGDSLLLLPGRKMSVAVNAKAGRRLFYICAVHPWMQGKIRVTKDGKAPH